MSEMGILWQKGNKRHFTLIFHTAPVAHSVARRVTLAASEHVHALPRIVGYSSVLSRPEDVNTCNLPPHYLTNLQISVACNGLFNH